MPASPTAPKSYGKKPYSGPGKPYAGKREGPPPRRDGDAPRRDYGDAPRPARFNRDDRPARSGGDRPIAARARIFARATAAARSVRIRRAKVVKNGLTPRAAIAAMRARRRVLPTRNSATSGPIRREARAARSGPTRRVARDSARTAIVRAATGPLPLVHAMATVPNENSAATRNFRAARRIAARARISATARIADPDRGESKPWQKRDASSPDHAGRNSRPPRDGARNFDKPNFDKPRFDKPRDDRGGDERPRFSRPREDRPQGDRPTVRPSARTKRASEIRSSARGSPGAQRLAGASALRGARRASAPRQ